MTNAAETCPTCPNYALDGKHPALDGVPLDEHLDVFSRLCTGCPVDSEG